MANKDLETITFMMQDEIREQLKDGLIFHFGPDDEIVVFADLHSVLNTHNTR
tara:strand:- start:911 stop:1066 length:156 start_codon:yes stop_codon:yes gene_type:complete